MKRILVFLFLGLGGAVWTCDDQVTVTQGRTYTIEYDHQQSYDVLTYGTRGINNAFEEAAIILQFIASDTSLADSVIWEDSLGRYYLDHVERDSTGIQALYDAYLCAVRAVCDPTGTEIDSVWGESSSGPHGWTFVCIDSELPVACWTKTVVHEFGHQLAGLSHLCLLGGGMNPAHSDSSCAMGQGWLSPCTGADLCWEPGFCESCINILKNQSW